MEWWEQEPDGVAQGRSREKFSLFKEFYYKGAQKWEGSWSGRKFLTSAARGLGTFVRPVQ